MPNGVHTGAARPPGEPQPSPVMATAADNSQRRELHHWWRQFRLRGSRRETQQSEQLPTGIFGVPLHQSIRYANVAISLYDAEGHSYIYGYVPIVVAKCGVYLKEKATEVEGIFRLAGSERRIKELKIAFDSPERYGKGLNWEGYTVHDAANILRRYFNNLPEPIVPLEFYERFRAPLRGHQEQAVGPMDGQSATMGDFDLEGTIREYQELITALPPLNRQLLLYILDLLAVFASKSDLNKMTTPNLAAIFQPGLISHPQHDMAPPEYRLSQDVLIFLIENQDHFLIGMQGTEADAKTVQDVESGPPTPQALTPSTPSRAKTVLGRSPSTSSAGADSVRKFGGVRRNKSVSSRHSRNSSNLSPVTPSFQGTPASNTGGVHRSNTLPTKRSPGVSGSRFGRDQSPGSSSPAAQGSTPPFVGERSMSTGPPVQGLKVELPASDAATSLPSTTAPNVAVSSPSSPQVGDTPPRGDRASRDVGSAAETPSGASISKAMSNFGGLFARSPSAEPRDGRRPNKLQKKRMAGSSNPSAHSSTNSLTGPGSVQEGPPSPLPPSSASNTPQKDPFLNPQTTEGTPQKQSGPGASLKPSASPRASFQSHSSATDMEPSASEAEGPDVENGEGATPTREEAQQQPPSEKKARRWRVGRESRDTKREKEPPAAASSGRENTFSTVGSNSVAHASHTSVNSAGETPRRSFQGGGGAGSDSELAQPPPPVGEEKERKGSSGPMKWIRGKMAERQERKGEKAARAKSPPAGAVRGEAQMGSLSLLNSSNSSPPREREREREQLGRGRSDEAWREGAAPVPQQQQQQQQQPPPQQPQPPPHQQQQQHPQQQPKPEQRPNQVVLQAIGPDSAAPSQQAPPPSAASSSQQQQQQQPQS